MEHVKFRRKSSADSGITFLERALNKSSTLRSSSTASTERLGYAEDTKGSLGLNLLHSPTEPLAELIFVHGLGGGSRKTWAKTTDPYHYWPKEWLPKDPDFKNVRIHSFGYVADWGEKKDSILDISDFAHSLLGEIKDNPEIRRDDAYMFARQDPAFKNLVPRFHSVFFLATPHRGSDLARTLTNILKVTYGQKPYVNELERSSGLISAINDTFRHYAHDLQLWSFYETLATNILLSNALVVDKSSAILGYAHERTALLNADHRGVCKFDQPSDPNYRTLRNALSGIVDVIITEVSRLRHEASRNDSRRLKTFLGISNGPEDDLIALQKARTAGSCRWFTAKRNFEGWRMSYSSASSILWLSGNPASGKSVLASHVIDSLEEDNANCSYFFFKHGIETKSSVSDCMRSLAYQMAICNADVRRILLVLEAEGVIPKKSDERSIWRDIFLGGVLQALLGQTQYWVIDGLDECKNFQAFFSMLSDIKGNGRVRILITSRKTHEIERNFGQLGKSVVHQEILESDTVDDIKSFITDGMDRLPVDDSNSRMNLFNRILTKSSGSFLWVRLVMQELECAWSEEAIEEVLNEIPGDMNQFYARSLENMSKVSRGTKLAKGIFTWTVCASRLLTLGELQCALKLDTNETVHNLEKSIAAICGQLVFVDQQSRVQMIHQTAKEFLLQEDLDSEFTVRNNEGHMRLAVKCLEFLSGNHFKTFFTQNQRLGIKSSLAKDFALADYACTFFSDHLYKCSSIESEPMNALEDFLNSNVLLWIEYLAKTGDLDHITRTAMNMKAFLERRSKYFPPIGQQFQTVEAWSIDLIRVSAKFRTVLLTSPSSIYWLIPPMCPSESIIARKFASPHRGITLHGMSVSTWDDCLSRIDYNSSQATAIDHGDHLFAIGLTTGKIFIYHSISSQVHHSLEHLERIKILKFGVQDRVLASSGLRTVRVWDVSNGNQTWSFDMTHQALALDFAGINECLLAATQGDYITCWGLRDGFERSRIPWHDNFEEVGGKMRKRQPPTHALFSPDRSLLAVSYRGRPILLFDVEGESFFGNCIRQMSTSSTSTHYPVVAMVFNPGYDSNILVASYGDGELVIYNSRTVAPCYRVSEVNAQALACSPDGRTLVTGSPFGTILLFDFDGAECENLTLIYHINAYEEGIKSLVFCQNSLRFLDIRGSQCRVWEPAVLVRKDLHDGNQSEISDPLSIVAKSVGMVEGEIKGEITAMICHEDGDIVFCGKRDGSVVTYQTQNGSELCILYKHAIDIAITLIAWGEKKGILASADESGRVLIRKIVKNQEAWLASDVLVDHRFGDSINRMLISAANDRLLVSGSDFDDVWTIFGQRTGSKTYTNQNLRTSICHPLNPDAFIIFTPSVARVFNWEDFRELTGSSGIKLNRTVESVFTTSTTRISCYGGTVVAELQKNERDQSSTRLDLWQTSEILASSSSITSLRGFDMLGLRIEHIIAVIGTRMLFLDTDLWVCSSDFTEFVKTPQVKRHFFIPLDWRNMCSEMLFQITSKSDFVFVKTNEVIIIKRGLDRSEAVPISGVLQSTLAHRKNLHIPSH